MFHTWLLRPVATDPLPSQFIHNPRPPAILVPDEEGTRQEEWAVEQIFDEREIGRRGRKKKQLLVKWVGYPDPTWEPREALENVQQLDDFEAARRGFS